jgi:predicted permease
VANLMLARLLRREREFAVRTAIGAGRGRLVRQLATESLVLTTCGALLGLAVAGSSLTLLRRLTAGFTARAQEVTMDGTVLLFTLGLAVATGIVFGLLPALPSGRSLLPSLTETGGGATGSAGRVRLRGLLVVAQVGISMVLLASAGLLIKSFVNLTRIDPGFRPEQTATWTVPLNFTKYMEEPARVDFYVRLVERLEQEPGFVAVGGSGRLPLDGDFSGTVRLRFRDRPVDAGRGAPQADLHVASPDYFKAIGVPLLAGRAFERRDVRGAPAVVVVNQSLASRYWGRANPIGQVMAIDDGEQWLTVVGVVGNARQRLDAEPTDEVYLPLFRNAFMSATFAARTTLPLPEATRRVRAAVAAIDPGQPVDTFRTLEDLRLQALAPPRLTAGLLGIFAALALVVTAVGLAGVIGFSVSLRTREFGVRLALGARRADLVALVLRQGLTLVAVGLVIGVVGAMTLARRLSTLLFGVEPGDPATLVVAVLVLVSVGAAACLLPARRAARVDPLLALKAD